MKATAAPAKKPSKSPRKAAPTGGKRADRRVPLEEMRRLMAVYGSLKCLRKRRAAPGSPAACDVPLKADSLKRKFYRWFPDLDARFSRDRTGFYTPKHGHEAEIRYREEMRAKDGEALAQKRARCRKGVKRGGGVKVERVPLKNAPKKKVLARAVTMEAGMPMPPLPAIRLEVEDPDSFSSDGEEVVDRSFVAERNIFDDVEKTFFTPPPLMEVSSGSSSEEAREEEESSIEEVLGKSIEECCEEILGSDNDGDSVSGMLFDMIAT
ncbi:hypothetical protein ACHAXT_009055 [Thalassiosira profunda]